MRGLLFGSVIIVLIAGSASAQSSLQGPLLSPDAVAAGAHTLKKTRPARKKVAHAAKTGLPSDAGGEVSSGTEGKSISHVPLPEDPLSYGMKWNGSNDSARDTRVQNYNGAAQGSGAELGMKLHF